jgi:hypothetical protein
LPGLKRFKSCLDELRREADAVRNEPGAGYEVAYELDKLAASFRQEEIDERGWPEGKKRTIESYVEAQFRERAPHLRYDELRGACLELTAELFERRFDRAWWDANHGMVFDEIAERVRRVKEGFSLSCELDRLLALHEELTPRAGLEGHVAHVIWALKLALDNGGHAGPRTFIVSQRRAAQAFLRTADPRWRGLEAVGTLAARESTVNANGHLDPANVYEVLQAFFEEKRGLGNHASKQSHENAWAEGIAAIVASSIGVLDEEHGRMTLSELKYSVREALTALGPKKRGDPAAMARAVLKRVGYRGAFSRKDDMRKSRARAARGGKSFVGRNVT